MVKTLHMKAEVPKNRELKVILPPDVPPGPADLVVLITSEANADPSKLGDLLRSEFFGSWKDREGSRVGQDYAKKLREAAWKRTP
jgi:hypothetical protein